MCIQCRTCHAYNEYVYLESAHVLNVINLIAEAAMKYEE